MCLFGAHWIEVTWVRMFVNQAGGTKEAIGYKHLEGQGYFTLHLLGLSIYLFTIRCILWFLFWATSLQSICYIAKSYWYRGCPCRHRLERKMKANYLWQWWDWPSKGNSRERKEPSGGFNFIPSCSSISHLLSKVSGEKNYLCIT